MHRIPVRRVGRIDSSVSNGKAGGGCTRSPGPASARKGAGW
jgi:hypothetical protein